MRYLHEKLSEQNHDVWVDWEDIPASADWWGEIKSAIEGADAFAFIISPNSLESEICRDEIQHAIDNNKRFIPILYQDIADVPTALVHSAIQSHNWIMFTAKSEYSASFEKLLQAMGTDPQYIRYHTRMLVRAKDWEQTDRNKSYLLIGRELDDYQEWFEGSYKRKPKPTDLQMEYLFASQGPRRRRRKFFTATLYTSLLVAFIGLGLGFGAWWYFNLPAQFTIQGNTENAFALLPGAEAPVSLASLNGQAPVGTLIQTGDEPLILYSAGDVIEVVLQADTEVAVNDLTDDNIAVQLGPNSGNISVETNGAPGLLTLPNGIDIELNSNIEVAIDPETDEVVSSCLEGSCTVINKWNNDSIEFTQGESLTLSNSSPNLSENILRVTPGEVAYVTDQHGTSEIYLMSLDRSNQTRFTNNIDIVDESPAWSPDGNFLTFVSDRSGSLDIWVKSSSGEEEAVNLTNNSSMDTDPAWSPDNTRIAFVSNRVNGVDDIYIMDTDGTNVHQITLTGGNISPAWSPDSTSITFSSNRGEDNEIYILDLSQPDSIPVNISNHPSSDTDPAWSHDSRYIAFVSNRDGNEEVYILDIADENAEPINVSHNSGRDFDPVWSPDSSRIMFTSDRFGDLNIISVSNRIDATAIEAVDVMCLTGGCRNISNQEAAWLPIIRAGQ